MLKVVKQNKGISISLGIQSKSKSDNFIVVN